MTLDFALTSSIKKFFWCGGGGWAWKQSEGKSRKQAILPLQLSLSFVITAWLTLALLEKKIDVYISPFLKPISLLQFFLLLGTVTLDKSKIIVTKSGLIAQNSRITLMLEIYSRRTSKISCLDTWLQNVNWEDVHALPKLPNADLHRSTSIGHKDGHIMWC